MGRVCDQASQRVGCRSQERDKEIAGLFSDRPDRRKNDGDKVRRKIVVEVLGKFRFFEVVSGRPQGATAFAWQKPQEKRLILLCHIAPDEHLRPIFSEPLSALRLRFVLPGIWIDAEHPV